MKTVQVLVITNGDEGPPAVGLVINGMLVEAFNSDQALLMSKLFAASAESLDRLEAAGPPYPESNWRN